MRPVPTKQPSLQRAHKSVGDHKPRRPLSKLLRLAGGRVEPHGAQERFRQLRRQEEKMPREVQQAEADGRDALDALVL